LIAGPIVCQAVSYSKNATVKRLTDSSISCRVFPTGGDMMSSMTYTLSFPVADKTTKKVLNKVWIDVQCRRVEVGILVKHPEVASCKIAAVGCTPTNSTGLRYGPYNKTTTHQNLTFTNVSKYFVGSRECNGGPSR
jgi:hypothetical protein